MAKRKKKKTETVQSKTNITVIVMGLFMILLSITGLYGSGIVGEWIKNISIFMFGSWNFLFLIFTLGLGLYMVFRSGRPAFFASRLVGIYSLIFALLIIAHSGMIRTNEIANGDIISTTYNMILESFKDATLVKGLGGGIIGALLTFASMSLFDVIGTYILAGIFIIIGIILVFDISLSSIFDSIVSIFRSVPVNEEDDEDEDLDEKLSLKNGKEEVIGSLPDNGLSDKKVVITSISDLNNNIKENSVTDEKESEEDSEPGVYVKPSINLLDPVKNKNVEVNSKEVIANNIKALEQVFLDFDMHVKVIEVHAGPAVTQYEMEISKGTRVNKVLSISREIALALAAKEVRIEAPIPGKNTVGVEIPNQNIIPVSMREIMEAMRLEKKLENSPLAAPLGRDIMGNVKYVEINKTPHMLVAGATGSGKSVCINNIILSVLMRTTPDEVKMVLVDPKKVEFNVYEGIPHLLTPVVTDPKKASGVLQRIVIEMDERYETFKNSGTKKIDDYNKYVENELKKNPDCGLRHMPYILVIIDELADLMLVAAKEVEESIMRITQLARAAGIHLIVATQRPSTDVITGVVKSNIPTRISFAVSSSIDSRTILDMTGAEKLLGKGDMLYKPMDDNNPTRIQGSFVGDDEIKRVVDFVKKRCSAPKYSDKFQNIDTSSSGGGSVGGSGGSSNNNDAPDVLYNEILEYAVRMGQISASLIQRKYSIGYNRAARIIDIFEERGIVGPAKGSKPRDVLVKLEDSPSDEE